MAQGLGEGDLWVRGVAKSGPSEPARQTQNLAPPLQNLHIAQMTWISLSGDLPQEPTGLPARLIGIGTKQGRLAKKQGQELGKGTVDGHIGPVHRPGSQGSHLRAKDYLVLLAVAPGRLPVLPASQSQGPARTSSLRFACRSESSSPVVRCRHAICGADRPGPSPAKFARLWVAL